MKNVSSQDELDRILAARGRAVVLFHATWCPYCRAFRPVFEKLTATTPDGYEPVEVVLDDEDNPLWAHYEIDAVPTVVFFDDGEVVNRLDARRGIGLTEDDLKRSIA